MKRVAILMAVVCCAPTHHQSKPYFTASSGKYKFENVVDLGDINEEQLAKTARGIQALADSGAGFVTMRINSPGGSIFGGLEFTRNMEDMKKRHGFRVACVVDGVAMSMAAVILESPLCDVRLATNRSLLLFHNGSTGARGNAGDLRQAGSFLDAVNSAMSLIVSHRLCLDVGVYRARLALGDWVLSVEDAIAVNAIDGIAAPDDIAPPVITGRDLPL